MRRLLQSSRFWVLLGSLLAAVLVSLGFGDDRASQTADLVVELLQRFGMLWVGTTAAEDIAKHLSAGKVKFPRSGMLGCLLLLLLVPACSLVDPGGDVRRATEAQSLTTWSADDSLTLQESTTHNRRVMAAEGENLEASFYPDGTPQLIKGGTHVLTQASEPKDATAAYIQLASKNAEVAGQIIGLVGQLVPLFAYRGQVPPPSPAPPGGGGDNRDASAVAVWLQQMMAQAQPSDLEKILAFIDQQLHRHVPALGQSAGAPAAPAAPVPVASQPAAPASQPIPVSQPAMSPATAPTEP